jgi:cell division protein FtsB
VKLTASNRELNEKLIIYQQENATIEAISNKLAQNIHNLA